MTGPRARYLLGVLVSAVLLIGMAFVTTPLFIVPAAAACGGTVVLCISELLTLNHGAAQ